jgi:hypothetical protein
MTDQEIAQLLERFDQTEPALQRRIVARFVRDRQLLLDACEAVILALDMHTKSPNPKADNYVNPAIAATQRQVAEDLVRHAVAKAREVRQ